MSAPVVEVKGPPLDKFIGQERLLAIVRQEVTAANIKNSPLPHMIFAGQPGLGKDTLIASIADARGATIHMRMGSQFREETITALAESVSSAGHDLQTGQVVDRSKVVPQLVWIDECEQLSTNIAEILHPILQPAADGVRRFQGKRPGSTKKRWMWFPEASFVFSTNYLGKLRKRCPALTNRCSVRWMFEPYSTENLLQILKFKASQSAVTLDDEAAEEIAKRSLGIPRTAEGLLRICNNALVTSLGRPTKKSDRVTKKVAQEALKLMGLDELGLEPSARMYLKMLAEDPAAKVGVDTLASTIGVDKETLTVDVEPFLIRLGLIRVIAGGREITDEGLLHVNASSETPIESRLLANF